MSGLHWLSQDPPVLYVVGWPSQTPTPAFAHEPIHVVVNAGCVLAGHDMARLADRIAGQFPAWTVHVVGTAFRPVSRTSNRCVFWLPEHVMLNTDFWDIGPGTDVNYDAILVGDTQPHKRHRLAADVPRLCCVAHSYVPAPRYEQWLRKQLAAAVFPFDPGKGWLPGAALRDFYRQSGCGLMLSGTEAGSRTIGEQMACGLPIVATADASGPLETADPAFLRIVPAQPSAVADAVRDFRDNPPDRADVRDAFLARVRWHRSRLEARIGAPLRWDTCPVALPWFANQEWPRC